MCHVVVDIVISSMHLTCLITISLALLTLCSQLLVNPTNYFSKMSLHLALSRQGIEIWGELLGTKKRYSKLLHAGVELVPAGSTGSFVARAKRSRYAGASVS